MKKEAREAFNRIAQTEDGKVFFRYLAYDFFGIKAPSLAHTKDGAIDLVATTISAHVGYLWQMLAGHLEKDVRNEIEKEI